MILDESAIQSDTPAAKVLHRLRDAGIGIISRFDSENIKIIQQLAGANLADEVRQLLGAISVLPESGFSTDSEQSADDSDEKR